MIWDSTESELRCRLVAKLAEGRDVWSKWQKLGHWLDCYQYILPDAREFSPIIIDSPSNLYHIWHTADLLQTCLTLNEQRMVWTLINESSTSPIRVSLHFTNAHASSNYTG